MIAGREAKEKSGSEQNRKSRRRGEVLANTWLGKGNEVLKSVLVTVWFGGELLKPGFTQPVSLFMVEVMRVFYYFNGFHDDAGMADHHQL